MSVDYLHVRRVGAEHPCEGELIRRLVDLLSVSLPAALFPVSYETVYRAFERGDYRYAYWRFRRLAQRGDARAARLLGDMHRNGYGAPQNYGLAIKWYSRAVDGGDRQARRFLGLSDAEHDRSRTNTLPDDQRGENSGRGGVASASFAPVARIRRPDMRGKNQDSVPILPRGVKRPARNNDKRGIGLRNMRSGGDQAPSGAANLAEDNGGGTESLDMTMAQPSLDDLGESSTGPEKLTAPLVDGGNGAASANSVSDGEESSAEKAGPVPLRFPNETAGQEDRQDVDGRSLPIEPRLSQVEPIEQTTGDTNRQREPSGRERSDLPSFEMSSVQVCAESGDVDAMLELAAMYRVGLGGATDPSAAAEWYRRAANAGSTEAQLQLGRLYHKGRGLRKNRAHAISWIARAAKGGHPRAAYELGFVLAENSKSLSDLISAYAWLSVARESGQEAAEALQNTLATELSPKYVAQAEKQVHRIWDSIYQTH